MKVNGSIYNIKKNKGNFVLLKLRIFIIRNGDVIECVSYMIRWLHVECL